MRIAIKQSDGEVRHIGEFNNGVFVSERRKSLHLYRRLNAWGVDSEVFNGLCDRGLHTVVIRDIEEQLIYETTAEKIRGIGVYLHHKPHRAQIFLPLQYWERRNFYGE